MLPSPEEFERGHGLGAAGSAGTAHAATSDPIGDPLRGSAGPQGGMAATYEPDAPRGLSLAVKHDSQDTSGHEEERRINLASAGSWGGVWVL